MGEQGQYQLEGEIIARVLEATHGIHEHELSDSRSVHEGRLPILIGQFVREECVW